MRHLFTAAATAAALSAALAVPALAATTTVPVTEADLGGRWSPADTRLGGSMDFGTFGERSAVLLLTDETNAAKVQLMTDLYDGTALADVTALGYDAYRVPTSGFVAGLAALNIRVDVTGDGAPDAYMVYEPYQDQGNAAVLTGAWQTWDAYRDGEARWWVTGTTGSAVGCGQATPCTWDAFLAAYPGATIEEGASFAGSLGLNLGSFNPSTQTYADTLTVGVGDDVTVHDFGPRVFSKDDCKDGGWQSGHPVEFRNQGDCVSYYASGGLTHGG